MKKTILAIAICLTVIMALAAHAGAANFTLTWDAVTTNTDGTPCTDLGGYKVYYGTASHIYNPIDVGNVLSHTMTGLLSETMYYFAVTAYDTSGNESVFSNEVSGIKPNIPVAPGHVIIIITP
jgi:chitodextrinase